MFTVTAFVVIALIAGVLIYAASRPDSFLVERSIRIQAPPQRVFAFINDLRLWGAWSPYEMLDPLMQRRYSGAEKGTGSVYEWEGNRKIGAGRMEIIDSAPASRVILELDFFRPIQGQNIAELSLRHRNGVTELRWEMDGPRPFIVKLLGLFLDMDGIIGAQFEQGLANLKSLAEEPPHGRGYWSGAGLQDATQLAPVKAA